jgi:hypothetical protein
MFCDFERPSSGRFVEEAAKNYGISKRAKKIKPKGFILDHFRKKNYNFGYNLLFRVFYGFWEDQYNQ